MATGILKLNSSAIWPCSLVLTILLASSRSEIAVPDFGFSYDKFGHFMVFGLLATAVLRMRFFIKKHWKGAFLTLLIVSSYGVLDECRQMLTAGRSVEFNDWLANFSGAFLA